MSILPLGIVGILVISILTPSLAVADAPPKQFNDKGHCVSALSAVHTVGSGKDKKTVDNYSKRELLTYLEGRVKIRESKLDSVDKLLGPTRNNVNYYNGKEPTVRAAIDAMRAKRDQSLSGLATDPAQDFSQASIPGRTLDMNALENSYSNARRIIGNARGVVAGDANSTRADIIEAACSSIFDARIFGDLVPLAKQSYLKSRIDIIDLMNTGLNVSRQQYIVGVYDAKKKSDAGFDADGSIKNSAGFAANPMAERNELATIVGSGIGGDAAVINSQLNDISKRVLDKNGQMAESFALVIETRAKKKQ